MAALKTITWIGTSRHEAKLAMGGRSDFIHSVGTLEKNFRRLQPIGRWLKSQGVKDLEQINSIQVEEYLALRLGHHLQSGNARGTFRQELSALAALECGLEELSSRLRNDSRKYDFREQREKASRWASQLPIKTSLYRNRAIIDDESFLSAIASERHWLMARLQLEAGCRAEGVGAPRKGENPFTMANLCVYGISQIESNCPDPVTGKIVRPIWTIEKGGKLAEKYCSVDLAETLSAYLKKNGALHDSYENYLGAINSALQATSQAAKGKGTHALRFAFAQRRYLECIRYGFVDEQAKLQVSKEMSHNRPDITEHYLR